MGENKIDLLKDDIISNTIKRSSQRPLNIVQIAERISELKQLIGSLSNVSELVQISTSTLNKFLSVFKLSSQVLDLVKSRKIDSIEIIYALKTLPNSDQNHLAKLIANGKLKSHDIRGIVPFRKKNMSENLDTVIGRVLGSKNIKIYTAYIELHKTMTIQKINEKLYTQISIPNIHEINIENGIVKISFTSAGYSNIKQVAKKHKITLKHLLNSIING